MSSRNGLIDGFKRIVGAKNVLTDAEDLYVYSLEHFFRGRSCNKLAIVVRVSTQEEIKRVGELAEAESVSFVRRSAWKQRLGERGEAAMVLIDDIPQPELEVFDEGKRREQLSDFQKELEVVEPGTFRSFSLALKSFFSGLPAQKCLRCDVCSGYCSVSSSFNGVETWSSKGRTLLTQALCGGELKPSPKLIDVIYSCSLCGLCFAQCFESTQVRNAIMDVRHRLAKNNCTPEPFTATAKNILEVGDPSGMPRSKRVAWIEHLPKKGVFPKSANVLYWAGCVVSTRTQNVAVSMGNLLNRAQIDFTFLAEKEGCCGYVLLATGLWNQAMENARMLIERVKTTGADTLVTTCAGCYYTFTKMYPEILNLELPCQVLHATQYTERLIEEGKIIPRNLDLRVTYHDPCSLGRHSNIYNSPRNVLKEVPNLNFVEMPLNRNRARCCGAGGGLWSFNNSIATNSAVERLVKDVTPLGASALVTACPTCHINFRNASIRKSLGIKVYDVMEILESSTATVPMV